MADTKFVNNPAVSQDASTIGYTPTGTVSATNVQAAIDEVVSDLASTSDPANGAALVGYAGSTADAILKNSVGKVVASIAALKAIDNTQYTQAFVTGYYAAGDGGGGVYWYDSSDTTSSENGGTIIVATDGGRWKFAGATISPKTFGAKSDGASDDTAAVQCFCTYIANNAVIDADFSGTYKVTSKITFDGKATATVRCAVELIAAFTAEDEVFLVQNANYVHFAGRIKITCGGHTTWNTRTNGIGIKVNNSSRATFDRLIVFYAKYDGFQGLGSSSQLYIGILECEYCGAARSGATGKTVNFTARSDTGSNGSAGQRTTLTLDEMPAGLTNFCRFVGIGGRPYAVMAVGANTIDVFPWVDSSIAATAPVQLYMGAGFYSVGSDTSVYDIGQIDAKVCAVGYLSRSLYPGSVETLVSQNCGIAHSIATPTSNACIGGSMALAYFESNDFDIVVGSMATPSYEMTNTIGLAQSKCFRMGPRTASNALAPQSQQFYGFAIGINGVRYSAPTNSTAQFSNLRVSPSPRPVSFAAVRNNTQTVTLNPPASGDPFQFQDCYFIVVGTGSNSAPTGTVTVTPTASYSINGGTAGASATFTGLAGATIFHAFLTGTDWCVTPITAGRVIQASVTYNPPSLADGTGATTTVTCAGAGLGDFAQASFSNDLQGITVTAWVSAADTVSVRFQNESGSTLDLASGTLRVRVSKV